MSSIPTICEGETRNGRVSFCALLDSGETLSGPAVTEETSSDLSISSVGVNAAAVVIQGIVVPAGQAVVYRVSGALANHSPYTLRVSVSTTSSPPQHLVRNITFAVEEP